MVTDKDIQKLTAIFVTKPEFNYEIQRIREEMATKEDLHQLESRIFTMLDKVMGELKIVRQEFAMHAGSHQRLNDDVDDLQTRVTVLEGN